VYGKRLIEKFQPDLNIVHTEHTKGAMIRARNRNFRAIEKSLDKQLRFMKQLEKMQKRTHRL
jgi:hypothetical protein